MLTKDILVRLGDLNRRCSPAAVACQPVRDSAPPLLGEERVTDRGTHWLLDRPVSQFWPQSERYLDPQRKRLPGSRVTQPALEHPQLDRLAAAMPRELLLLDLETCGFAGSMVFLIGLLYQQDNQLRLVQLLARNYAEEAAIFHSLWQLLPRRSLLVTFNGKAFDWPVVLDRTILHRLKPGGAASIQAPAENWDHCDLLHHARRKWKTRLPNCRLQTLEWHVCGRSRQGDIPGRLIPEAYHHFVRSGDAGQMQSILHHNALDLVTLFQLSLVLTGRGSAGNAPA
ncbi:MAG: ribonuclease H-like domain-containing protein [Pirellulaceae bacterium]|nr:ribonuclease H-like domain-containing protein [Pirellulaceae bacterium]